MAQDNKTFKKRERGPIVNFPRFSMWAAIEGGRRAQLVWGIQDGNPRLTVFYPKTDATDRTPSATVAMGFDTTMMVFQLMEDLAKKAENRGTEVTMENIRNTYEQGSSTPTGKTPSTTLIIGRDEEGVYYFEVKDIQYPKPAVKFHFLHSSWHNFSIRTQDGIKPLSKMAASQLMFTSLTTALRNAYSMVSLPANAGISGGQPDDAPAAATPAAVNGFAAAKAPTPAAENFDDVTF